MDSIIYRFQCDLCSHPDFDAALDDAKCPCGRDPTRYCDGELEYCFLHRQPMTKFYLADSSFILTHYAWSGHQHLFPNAVLYRVTDPPAETDEDSIKFYYCDQCESTMRDWIRRNADSDS